MRNVLDKALEKMKTHILCAITFSENCTVYEIMSKNIVETEKPQITSQYGAYALHPGLARLFWFLDSCLISHKDRHQAFLYKKLKYKCKCMTECTYPI